MLTRTIEGLEPREVRLLPDERPNVVGYRAAHMRVVTARGAAASHSCVDCSETAAEWSYDHSDPDEVIADDRSHAGMPYSTNTERYAPRCRPCHVAFDKAEAQRRRGQVVPPLGDLRPWLPELQWEVQYNLRRMQGIPDQPLDDLHELIGFFISFQEDADVAAVALWVAATHLAARGVGRHFPRLAIIAPSYGSGKSTLLELVARLSHKGEVIGSGITDATLPRTLMEEGFATLCIDEADKTLRPENHNAIAILNTGWERGGTARLNLPNKEKGWRNTPISVFSPVALAGNGVTLGEDTLDRTITVRLFRDLAAPELRWEDVEGSADRLRERLSQWAEDVAAQRNVQRPPMPLGIGGRDRDRWAVLSSAAEGTCRADWREAVSALCASDHMLRDAAREEAGPAPQERLLLDLWEWLPVGRALSTEQIVLTLQLRSPDRYGVPSGQELTARRLGSLLHGFWGLQSQRLTFPDGTRKRGYTWNDLARPWRQLGLPVDEAEAS